MKDYLRIREERGFRGYQLNESTEDDAISRGLDLVKLSELEDHDYTIYNTFKDELQAKYSQDE